MCGITGIFHVSDGDGTAPWHDLLRSMTAALAHRGPDDEGIEAGGFWGLGTRRLAIIGVPSGHQPMANEDRTLWVTFNGEIYNHNVLRRKLKEQGHQFRTAADTEVLLHLYEQCDGRVEPMVRQLEGMFAFGLVDVSRRRLILARDRLGKKPLFYSVLPAGEVVFASELGAILKHPGVPRELNRQAVDDYLNLMCIPAPDTVFRSVQKLPPSCWIEFWQDHPPSAALAQRYWRPAYERKSSLSLNDAAAQARDILDRAVVKRLEYEVPLGAFLSGGLDSSVVVALMQRHVRTPVRTFTVGFEVERYDERRYARLAAAYAGTQHQERVAEPRDLDLLRRLVKHHGEPYCDSSMLPTALLCQFTRQHVTVALSGDGGDELFGGYQRYQIMWLQRYLQAVPLRWRRAGCNLLLRTLPEARAPRTTLASLRRLLAAFGSEDVAGYAGFQQVFSAAARRELYREPDQVPCLADVPPAWEEILRQGSAREFVERFMELDLHAYLPSDILAKVDIASMMFSLEVRCPFLDHELVEFMAALPRQYKVGPGYRKRLLQKLARGLVPEPVRRRGKRGFGVPLAEWFRGDLRNVIRELGATETWDAAGLFRPDVVRRLVEEHLAGTRDHSFRLWALLCLKLWWEEVGSVR